MAQNINNEHNSSCHVDFNTPVPTHNSRQPKTNCSMHAGRRVIDNAVERNSWGKSGCEWMCHFPNTGGLRHTSGDAPLETGVFAGRPVLLCIVLGRKMNDETRITLAVNYLVINFNPCKFFGSHEGAVDSKYNLIATVNHKPSQKNDGHYTAVNKSPTSKSWYKYDNNMVKLVSL
jgi:hypothetical protein